DEPAPDAPPAGEGGGAAVEHQLRRFAGHAHDLDLPPRDPLRPARPERLHGRLLRRESRRIAGEAASPPRLAVLPLLVGEDPRLEASPRRRLEGVPDASDVADVEANPD